MPMPENRLDILAAPRQADHDIDAERTIARHREIVAVSFGAGDLHWLQRLFLAK